LNPATAAEGAAIGFGIGGPPGAVVGGVIGFGLGAWGTYEFWNWYNNENVNDDGGDDSPKQCDEGSQRGNPYHGEPGTWAEHPHGKQDRLYGPDGTPAVDIDYGHDHGQGSPHAHNWDNGIRGPGVPVTVLPK
ncbi:MAG TPA: hypothetical protein ENJ86_09820, partial [Methylothermaceae bacterium]|nr:hypothetical protein [Methylothermaceae bacterium]